MLVNGCPAVYGDFGLLFFASGLNMGRYFGVRYSQVWLNTCLLYGLRLLRFAITIGVFKENIK